MFCSYVWTRFFLKPTSNDFTYGIHLQGITHQNALILHNRLQLENEKMSLWWLLLLEFYTRLLAPSQYKPHVDNIYLRWGVRSCQCTVNERVVLFSQAQAWNRDDDDGYPSHIPFSPTKLLVASVWRTKVWVWYKLY